MPTYVFHANALFKEYPQYAYMREVPNGAYLYNARGFYRDLPDRCWYRSDMTPVLLHDVPTLYRTMALLLT